MVAPFSRASQMASSIKPTGVTQTGQPGPEIISCPTCGRTNLDIAAIATQVEERLKGINKNIKVAVMGCAVNGPGEAREADIGIACGVDNAVMFKKGERVKVLHGNIIDEFVKSIYEYLEETN